jgi:hypothetical protein
MVGAATEEMLTVDVEFPVPPLASVTVRVTVKLPPLV